MMFLIFILGFFIEWIEINYIAVPLFLPVLLALLFMYPEIALWLPKAIGW